MLIGLTGYKRSGKDSTAAVLADYGFEKYAFADALRSMALSVNPMISLEGAPEDIREHFTVQRMTLGGVLYSQLLNTFGYEAAKEVPDFRRFLQNLGTDGVRSTFGDNAWVDALDKKLREDGALYIYDDPMMTSGAFRWDKSVVLTDVRFPNEAAYVHKYLGEVWRIERPGFGGDDPHPSEAFIATLPADRVLHADNLIDLRAQAVSAIEGVLASEDVQA